MARSRSRLFEASELHERLPQPPPRQRTVRGLFQRMTKQALGIVGFVGRERERGKTAQRRHMTRILLQDLTKQTLRCLPVVDHEAGRRLLNPRPMRIGKPRALEGNARVRILLEVDQRITVRKPCEVVMWHFLQHPAHFLACPRSASVAPAGTRQIDARVREIGEAGKQCFERRDALGDFVLVQ